MCTCVNASTATMCELCATLHESSASKRKATEVESPSPPSKRQKPGPCYLEAVPADVSRSVLSRMLDVKDVFSLAQCSKSWRMILNDHTTWRHRSPINLTINAATSDTQQQLSAFKTAKDNQSIIQSKFIVRLVLSDLKKVSPSSTDLRRLTNAVKQIALIPNVIHFYIEGNGEQHRFPVELLQAVLSSQGMEELECLSFSDTFVPTKQVERFYHVLKAVNLKINTLRLHHLRVPLMNLPQLTALTTSETLGAQQQSSTVMPLVVGCTSLIQLELHRVNTGGAEFLRYFGHVNLRSLHCLTLVGFGQNLWFGVAPVPSEDYITVFSGLKHLTSLTLDRVENFGQPAIDSLLVGVSHAPILSRLVLRSCHATAHSLRTILQSGAQPFVQVYQNKIDTNGEDYLALKADFNARIQMDL